VADQFLRSTAGDCTALPYTGHEHYGQGMEALMHLGRVAQFIAVCRRSKKISMGLRRYQKGSRLCMRCALPRRRDTPRRRQIVHATQCDTLSDRSASPHREHYPACLPVLTSAHPIAIVGLSLFHLRIKRESQRNGTERQARATAGSGSAADAGGGRLQCRVYAIPRLRTSPPPCP
jgi:hypothetical protein